MAKTRRPELIQLCKKYRIPFKVQRGWCLQVRAAARKLPIGQYIAFMNEAKWKSII
ncbi:hypothetical protein PAAL109150_07150 [Paenibacillus alkaliterrae]